MYMYFPGTRCVASYDHKHSTIRCSHCELPVHVDQSETSRDQDVVPCCARCKQYRHNLRSLVSRSKRKSGSDRTHPSRHTPFYDLTAPEKAKRYQREHELRRSCESLLLKVDTEKHGFTEDLTVCDDLSDIMAQSAAQMESAHPPGSFARVFWDSQRDATGLKDARQMRWHPLMVRWCLYLC